jgi:hypothetical protein
MKHVINAILNPIPSILKMVNDYRIWRGATLVGYTYVENSRF